MREQPRVIGGLGAMAVVAGSMIGIGIFLTPTIVSNQVDSLWAYLLCWLVGGMMAFSGATCYAELGSRFPAAGGDYVFVREAFGSSMAFATGLLLTVGVFVGSIATMAVAVSTYQIGSLLGLDWGTNAPAWGPQAVGVLIILSLTVINILGARLAVIVQLVVTLIPVVLFSLASVYAVGVYGVESAPLVASGSVRGMASAMTAVYFAYAGWNAAAYVGGEVKNPGRNIPLGLVGGTVFVTLVYLLMNLGFVAVLGLDGVREAFEVGTATAQQLGGETVRNVALLLIVLALLGSINATVLGGARIALALAEDGMLPAVLGRSREGTPYGALVGQAAVAVLMVLSGTFEALLEMTSIAMLLIASLAVMAMVKLRHRSKATFTAQLYPLTPLFFVLSSAVIMGLSLWNVVDPVESKELLQRYLPVVGLVLFAAAYVGHRVLGTPAPESNQTQGE